jgi:hypothetical protein
VSAPTFYREATLRGIIESTDATTRYLDALKDRGIIFGWRIDAIGIESIPTILPEDIIKAVPDPEIEGTAKAELAFDPNGFALAEEPHEVEASIGFLWQGHAQEIIDHIVRRSRIEDRATHTIQKPESTPCQE